MKRQKNGKTVEVHLKIETGMGRIGIAAEKAVDLTRESLKTVAISGSVVP
jgi:alanine racemase